MENDDTIKLLRECDAGIRMGIASIDEVMDSVQGDHVQNLLAHYKEEHEKIQDEVIRMLAVYHDEGKAPIPMAKGMSWMKTTMKLSMEESDATVADLMTDGCNMGVKSLNRYLNEYKAADEEAKGLAKQLITLEEQMAVDLRGYL
ncbi:MAG: hypothetical protein PHP50_02310 [Lachnospiraceae bacterium]|nr:hypothetical protein [Lachnospiraceae bacterium]